MAGVIGFVLVLAVVVSYYAYVAKENVPRWGADNERTWDRRVGESMTRLARDAATSAGDHTSVAAVVPGYPEPKAFEVPLLGRTEPVSPSGTLTFHTRCTAWWVNASVVGGPLAMAESTAADGCLDFRAHPVYSGTWGYRYEYGALLRVEEDRAVMVAGPPLKLRVLTAPSTTTPERYEMALTLVDLRGPGSSSTADRTSVPVDLIASGAGAGTDATAASRTDWALKTQYPEAWKTWFEQRFRGATFDETTNVACTAANNGGPGPCGGITTPEGEVRILLFGPRDDATADVSLSLTRATYDVSLR